MGCTPTLWTYGAVVMNSSATATRLHLLTPEREESWVLSDVLGGSAREGFAQYRSDGRQEAVGGKWFLKCRAALLCARPGGLGFLGARQEQHAELWVACQKQIGEVGAAHVWHCRGRDQQVEVYCRLVRDA